MPLLDVLLRSVTLISAMIGMIAIYIAIRNHSRQIGVQIFLSYSNRLNDVRHALADGADPASGIRDAVYIIFEFFSLRRCGYIAAPVWAIWEADIMRFLDASSFREAWPAMRADFDVHPAFVAWIERYDRLR